MAGKDPPAGTQVSYSRQYRRCGRASCPVCGPGGTGHGPYWYAFWREDGRARSRYLGREAPQVLDGRTVPDAGPERALRVRSLGAFAVRLGGELVPDGHWRGPVVAALFKALLSAPGHRLTRDQALEALWPEAGQEQATARLRTTIHRLRQALGADHLAYRDEVLALAPGAGPDPWLDADAFEVRARAALERRDAAACRAALALYGGDYLPDDRYADWAVERREELRQLRLAVLLHAAALCEQAGEMEEAERHLRAILAADRCHEGAARALMRLHAQAGRPAQALRVYRRLADALRDELDLAPEPATRVLQRALEQRRQAAPPAAPEPVRGANLPVPATSFIGRRHELAAICSLLAVGARPTPDPQTGDREAPCRLVTLTGPGGVGKTRLALAAADELLDDFPDGAWLVDLAPLADPSMVVNAAARAVGLAEEPGRPPLEALVATLRHRRALLVLDNCEHLIEPCAELAAGVLAACPSLRILATSRERLDVPGERAWPVPPLTLPDERGASAAGLPRSEAARLFLERARAQRPDLALTDERAATIARICSRLAGIPLAIELAAARAGVLGPEAIAARLDQSLGLLAGGPRSAPSRQRTLRATLDWSWGLLEEGERTLLRRLSVFAGGWTLEAAEAVCADGDTLTLRPSGRRVDPMKLAFGEVLDLLAGLGRKSLLLIEDQAGETRYGLLEMVRQYALERLAEAGEAEAVRGRHLVHYLALVERADPALRGPEQAAWLAQMEAEHHNLRAALAWARERGEVDHGLRIVGLLVRFWEVRGHLAEGLRWTQEFLRLPRGAPGAALSDEQRAVRARALRGAGILAADQGDYAAALALYEESLGLLRALGDRRGVAMVLNNQAIVALQQGDLRRAQALFEGSLALLRDLGEKPLIASSLNNLAMVARGLGDYARAAHLQEEALALQRQLGDTGGAANSLSNLGALAFDRGDYRRARALFEESLTLQRALGNTTQIATITHALGSLAVARGDYNQAAQLCEEALAMRREVGDLHGVAYSLNDLGHVALQQGDEARAMRLLEESLAIRRELGERTEVVKTLSNLALAAARRGDDGRAEALFDEAISRARQHESRPGLVRALHDRGWAALWRGDHRRAAVLLAEGLELARDLGNQFWTAGCLEAVAALTCRADRPALAVHLLGAAAGVREALDAPTPPLLRPTCDRAVAETRAALGEEAFAAAWAEGRAMALEQAIALVPAERTMAEG